jgi:starch synthase
LRRRIENKIQLQKEFGLEVSEETPVLGMVGRLDEQKGIDLLFPILETLISEFNCQFVIVGGGEPKYRSFFEEVNKKFPRKVGCHLMSDFTLARHIFAGCDLFLIPSKFEPCGITQMEAMRYGAIPVVRKTGGLADTVQDFDPIKNKGTGFVFEKFHHYSLLGAIVRALETYKYKKVWQDLMKRAMKSDFSWEASAKKYIQLYNKLKV